MKNLILIVSLAISLTGVFYKTTTDGDNEKNKLNKSGFLLVALMFLSLGFSLYVNYTEGKNAEKERENKELKDSISKKGDSLKNRKNEENWEKLEIKNKEVISRLKKDSSNNAEFQDLQRRYIVKSDRYNQLLSKKLGGVDQGINNLRNPIDTITMDLFLNITLKKEAIEEFENTLVSIIAKKDNEDTFKARVDSIYDSSFGKILNSSVAVMVKNKIDSLSYVRYTFYIGNFLIFKKVDSRDIKKGELGIAKPNFESHTLHLQIYGLKSYANIPKNSISFRDFRNAYVSVGLSPPIEDELFSINLVGIKLIPRNRTGRVIYRHFKKNKEATSLEANAGDYGYSKHLQSWTTHDGDMILR